MARVADWFIEGEQARLTRSKPVAFEDDARGLLELPDLGFTLRGVADRIDRNLSGEIQIYDYKTGNPPTDKQQKHFDKQLLIEAAMVEEGAFKKIGAAPVSRATFIGLGNKPVEIDAPLEEEPPQVVLENLRTLIAAYLDPAQGFTGVNVSKIVRCQISKQRRTVRAGYVTAKIQYADALQYRAHKSDLLQNISLRIDGRWKCT